MKSVRRLCAPADIDQEEAVAKKALCIGINDYPGTDTDLSGCVNDAHDWAETLGGRGFAVQTLFDRHATRQAMIDAITDLVHGAVRGDTVVMTYSGHGTWVPDKSGDEPDGRDEGLCPYDIGQGRVLLDDDLHEIFSGRAARVRVILISDSCHSGSVSRGPEDDLDPNLPRARFLAPAQWMNEGQLGPTEPTQPRALLGGMSRTGGDLLLAGCQDTEYSWDTRFGGRPNGAFTYYALKTLKTLPANASYATWFSRIRDYLPSSRLPQHPQILGSSRMRSARVFE